MSLTIRPFDHTPDGPDWPAYRALLERVYGPKMAARRKRALRWVTLKNPVDLLEERRYVAEEGGRVVTGLGRMPVRFTVAGEPLLLRFSHVLLARPDEPDVITALVREALRCARAAGASALVALNTLPAFRRRLAGLGFMKAPRLRTFVLGDLEGRCDEGSLGDAGWWYLTFGDSDGGMWTGAQPEERV
jgi:hypothetical protein